MAMIRMRQALDGPAVDAVVTAAQEHAVAAGDRVVIAVVDPWGHLLSLSRTAHAQVASVGVATDKARTAAIYRRPSKDFEDQAASGRPSALHLAGAVPQQGGVPIWHDDQVAGAIGVSGASSAAEDSELAAIGAQALQVGVQLCPRLRSRGRRTCCPAGRMP